MANAFSKEERVAFEDILEGFQDALVLSRNVSLYNTNSTEMERTNNIIWRPQPYIMQSFTGTDMTSNFKDDVQLSVPATLGFNKSVPWVLTATELRDALQEGRLGSATRAVGPGSCTSSCRSILYKARNVRVPGRSPLGRDPQ